MKKHIAIIIFLILSGLFICLFGFKVRYAEIFGIVAVLFVYSAFVARDIFKKSDNKFFRFILGFYQVIAGLFVISFIVFEGILWSQMEHLTPASDIPNEPYAIVLGSGLDGYEPGLLLRTRLDKAVQYLNLNPNTKAIVSGGQGPGEVEPEAVAMKAYLVSKGIDPGRIIEENKARSTMQNIKFSRKILQQRGAGNDTVVIITSDFHLPRAMLLANLYDVNAVGLAARTPIVQRVNYSIRSYPAYIFDLLRMVKHKTEIKIEEFKGVYQH